MRLGLQSEVSLLLRVRIFEMLGLIERLSVGLLTRFLRHMEIRPALLLVDAGAGTTQESRPVQRLLLLIGSLRTDLPREIRQVVGLALARHAAVAFLIHPTLRQAL